MAVLVTTFDLRAGSSTTSSPPHLVSGFPTRTASPTASRMKDVIQVLLATTAVQHHAPPPLAPHPIGRLNTAGNRSMCSRATGRRTPAQQGRPKAASSGRGSSLSHSSPSMASSPTRAWLATWAPTRALSRSAQTAPANALQARTVPTPAPLKMCLALRPTFVPKAVRLRARARLARTRAP